MSFISFKTNAYYLDMVSVACDIKKTIRGAKGLEYDIGQDSIKVSSDFQTDEGIVIRVQGKRPTHIYTPIGYLSVGEMMDPEESSHSRDLFQENIKNALKAQSYGLSCVGIGPQEELYAISKKGDRQFSFCMCKMERSNVSQDKANQLFQQMLQELAS